MFSNFCHILRALIITLLGSLGIIISILAYKETIRIKLLLVMLLLIGSLVAFHLVYCHILVY